MMQRIGYAVLLIALFTKLMLLYVVEWRRDMFGILFFMSQANQIDEEENVRKRYNNFYLIGEKAFAPRPRASIQEESWDSFAKQRLT
jgi:hypothetical protein